MDSQKHQLLSDPAPIHQHQDEGVRPRRKAVLCPRPLPWSASDTVVAGHPFTGDKHPHTESGLVWDQQLNRAHNAHKQKESMR
jgi:hypothetical protein